MSSARINAARQRRTEQGQSPWPLGHAVCIRTWPNRLQFQSGTLGRILVPLEAVHPTCVPRAKGMQGEVVVRLWWAQKMRLA